MSSSNRFSRKEYAWLPGQSSFGIDTYGSTGVALAIAYIAVGAFIQFHYCWGLHAKLHVVRRFMKLLAVLTFLGCLGYAAYQIMI